MGPLSLTPDPSLLLSGDMRPETQPLTSLVHPLAERAAVREILMGAQDNLTNVLAVVLGVAIGAGRADLVALAGLAAATAEAVSMGGVLYTSTRAEQGLDRDVGIGSRRPARLTPAQSGLITFAAALAGGLIPLTPFLLFDLTAAVVASLLVSLAALFALGSWTGRIGGHVWWRDGIRVLVVAGLAAMAAAAVGLLLQVDRPGS